MSDKKNELNDLFTNLAKENQKWFQSLLETNDATTKDNPLLGMYQQFIDNSKLFLEAQQQFYQNQIEMFGKFFANMAKANDGKVTDKRFASNDWDANPFFSYIKQSYLNVSKYLFDFITQSNMDQETKERLSFFMGQYLDAISPTNFALTNPEVIKGMVETQGGSLAKGMQNMLQDMQKGYMTMTDEAKFSIGGNLAITKGEVVFKNDLIELIQYSPTTTNVHEIPLLVVPPCINKYYILDLGEENSFVKYLVDQGYTVYLISWRSAVTEIRNYHWNEYVNLGVIEALEVIRAISKQPKINTLGYCIGGVILTTAALVLKSKKLNWINSMTHMTVMLDHSDPGDIKYFIDRDLLELKSVQEQGGGIMSGRVISQTFSALRANELIWNYWINNYLLGKTPDPFDILFWNSDAVDLPVNMHSFLLKRLYVHNELVKGKLVVGAINMDISKLDMPMYLFAAQKDHIVPWHSAYATTQYVKSKNVRFVLGASGHTAGVVNPASLNKRNYWVNSGLASTADKWFEGAKEVKGSWWVDLSQWLSQLSGGKVKAKKTLGSTKYPALYAAPGQYVKAKALSVVEAGSV